MAVKLLYITEDRFPPYRADVVELFAKKMPEYGHQIDWLMQPKRGENSGETEKVWSNCTVYFKRRTNIDGILGRTINLLLDILGDWRILLLAVRNRYDIIQVRDRYFTCIPAWIASRIIKAKFVYWMSYPFPESRLYLARESLTNKRVWFFVKGFFSYGILYGFIVRVADHIFVQSDEMKKMLKRKRIPSQNMTSVFMGVSTQMVTPPLPQKRINTNAPVLFYLGTLVRIRHLELLIDVLKLVRKKHPGTVLILVGGDEGTGDRKYLEAEARRLNQESHVQFTGHLDVGKAWRYLEKADICLSPIYPISILQVGSPTKLIEYMAMAKVVVANEHPEQTYVLEQSGVGHAVPWSTECFSDEILRILENPEEALQKAARGPDYVRKYRTYDCIAKRVDHQFREILRG